MSATENYLAVALASGRPEDSPRRAFPSTWLGFSWNMIYCVTACYRIICKNSVHNQRWVVNCMNRNVFGLLWSSTVHHISDGRCLLWSPGRTVTSASRKSTTSRILSSSIFPAKKYRRFLSTKNKKNLQDILTKKRTAQIVKNLPKSHSLTCLLVDTSSFIEAIGQPEKACLFKDLVDF